MFFEQIELSKKSWHYKLQQMTFGKKMPNYFSFCPYFWLTILCMIISPVTFTIHLFNLPFKLIDKFICQGNIENWMLNDMNAEDIQNILINYYIGESTEKKIPFSFNKKYKTIQALRELYFNKKYNLNIDDKDYEDKKQAILDELRKKSDELYMQRQKARQEKEAKESKLQKIRKEKRKELEAKFAKGFYYIGVPFRFIFTPIVKLSKFLSNTIKSNDKLNIGKLVKITKIALATIIIGFVAYFLVKGILALEITSWNWKSFGLGFINAFYYSSLAMIAGFTIYGILTLLINTFEKTFKYLYNNVLVYRMLIDKLESFFVGIGAFLFVIVKMIASPFKLFIIFIKTFKENNCPALTFKEDK